MQNINSIKWSFTVLENMISNKAEESINLDFKSSGSLDKSERKKIEITKDVSAFANSDGGVIIYGIKESNFVADEFSFIDGTEYTKEWLEQIINSGIQQKIEDIIIYPIRKDGDIKKTIYIVEIPESTDSPHMAKDKRYYKRYNFESVPMEDYEIRRLFFKINKTNLEIGKEVIGVITHNDNPDKTIGISFGIKIKNIGNTIEKHYKVQIELPTIEHLPMYCDDMMNSTNDSKTHLIFSSTNKAPLFQSEEIIIGSVIYNFEEHKIDLINKDLDVIVTLFYSSGSKQKKIKLSDIYKKVTE
jgi:hypothetical protein